MRTTRLRRSLAAVATTVACLAVMATPAAAVAHDATVATGVITLSKTGIVPETIDLSNACLGGGGMAFEITTLSIGVTALNSSAVWTFGTTGTFLAVLTRSTAGNSSGSFTHGIPHYISPLRVGIVMTVYNTSLCSPFAPVICTLAFVLSLSGTSTSSTSSNTFSLTGSSVGNVVAFPTCAQGPSYLIGTSASVTWPVTGHLTT